MATQNVQNLRKTAGWAKLGKVAFSNEILKLNPTALVSLLKGAGINVPPNVQMGADVVQIIASGGAFVSAVERGSTIGSYLVPGAQVTQAVTDILQSTGLMNPASPAAELLTLGSDIALVLAAGGLNILADLKFILDVATLSQVGQGVADGNAMSNLNDMLKARSKLQTDALSQNFKNFHESKINVFDLIGLVAEQSPDYFPNYFPQLKMFFPVGPIEIYSESSYTDLFGTHTSHASQIIQTLTDNNHDDVINTIWDNLCYPSISPFIKYDGISHSQNLIGSQALGLLSVMPPYVKAYSQSFNAYDLMKNFSLTPSDLGETNLIHDFLVGEDAKAFQNQGVTFNGLTYQDPYPGRHLGVTGAQDVAIINADEKGNLSGLSQYADVLGEIKRWGNPGYSSLGNSIQTINMRNFSNYFSVLSMVDQIKNDKYFMALGVPKTIEVQPQIVTVNVSFSGVTRTVTQPQILKTIQPVRPRGKIPSQSLRSELSYKVMGQTQNLPSPEKFSSMAQDLYFKIHCRGLNKIAMQNISNFTGIAPAQLRIINKPKSPGEPALFYRPPITIKPLKGGISRGA